MSELLIAIAMMCSVHTQSMHAMPGHLIQAAQRKCVAEIMRCYDTRQTPAQRADCIDKK